MKTVTSLATPNRLNKDSTSLRKRSSILSCINVWLSYIPLWVYRLWGMGGCIFHRFWRSSLERSANLRHEEWMTYWNKHKNKTQTQSPTHANNYCEVPIYVKQTQKRRFTMKRKNETCWLKNRFCTKLRKRVQSTRIHVQRGNSSRREYALISLWISMWFCSF